jgi:hypothetical protein
MDKHTLQIIVWLCFAACWLMTLRALYRGWSSGEFTYSRTGSFSSRKITRDGDPGRFQLYLVALIALSVTFLIVLAVFGWMIFIVN